MTKFKQVIVMRTDLNMRKGKMVAQGAHASLEAAFGRTEFNEPTRTCLAIGPAPEEGIDRITGGLRLL